MNPAEGGALGEKRLVEACPSLPFHAAAMPLRALYFIGSGKAVATDIDALGPTRAMAELINHSFLLDVTEPERLSQHFHDVGELAETVPCYTLDYPRDYAALPQVIAAVLKHAGLKVEDR